jgi:hypothetical protein
LLRLVIAEGNGEVVEEGQDLCLADQQAFEQMAGRGIA